MVVSLLFALWSVALAQTQSPVMEIVWSRFWRDMVVEGAGIFWLIGELAILYAVSIGGRVLRERPLPGRLVLTRRERLAGAGLALFSVGLVAAVFGRFLVWTPMPLAMEAAAAMDWPEIPDIVHADVVNHIQVHITIWCAFIAAWVIIESTIVVQGIRAFHALSAQVQSAPARVPAAAFIAAVAGALALFATDASALFTRPVELALQSGYRQALDDARVGYRFMELYLRVAGAVWVIVEWIAAIYLMRGYWLLRRLFRGGSHVA